MLTRLEATGIERSRIVILIATGLHRPATENEIREIVGEEIASRYRVENDDARRREDHRFLGTTKSGTPASIDERFVSADLRHTLGFIEPHRWPDIPADETRRSGSSGAGDHQNHPQPALHARAARH